MNKVINTLNLRLKAVNNCIESCDCISRLLQMASSKVVLTGGIKGEKSHDSQLNFISLDIVLQYR